MFVLSTSSAAGGLPLGVVVTSGESSSIVYQAMCALKRLFPEPFYGEGSPENVITDDSSAEREGLKIHGLQLTCIYVYSIFYKVCGDGLHAPKMALLEMNDNI